MDTGSRGKAQPTRRDFVKTSGAILAAAAAIGPRAYAQADSGVLRVGLIGCGGRGTSAARQALLADPQAKLVAMGDAFADRVEDSLKRLAESDVGDRVDVPEDRRFTDFDNYKHVCDVCDVVVMASPPGFRPIQLKYAIEKGCHVFAEKPIAVDAPGVRSVMETCRVAKDKGLSVVSGLCYRYQFAKQDIIKRVQDGAVGQITAMETKYLTGELWHHGRKDGWTEMEYQMRNWLYFDWLSGDHINEQHIHSLDKILWVMNDEPPVKCKSSGGRIRRTDPKYGNIYDNFNTTYEWASGVKAFSACRQWNDCHNDVSDHIFGTKGIAHIQDHTIELYDGGKWAHEPSGPDDMYQNEHNALFAAIRKGEPKNDGAYMCKSTLMAIMGRVAAYTGEEITWDQAWNSQLDLTPEYKWGDIETRPVPVPGVYKFV